MNKKSTIPILTTVSALAFGVFAADTQIEPELACLGAQEYNAPNRNYYFSYANELESGELSEVWF